MFGNLKELDKANKPGAARKRRRDIGERHFEHLRDENLPRRQHIPAAHSYMRALPESHRTRDFTASNAIS